MAIYQLEIKYYYKARKRRVLELLWNKLRCSVSNFECGFILSSVACDSLLSGFLSRLLYYSIVIITNMYYLVVFSCHVYIVV